MMSANILPETDLLDQIWNYWYFSRGKQDRKLCIQPVYNKLFVSPLQKLAIKLPEMNWHQFPWMKLLWITSFFKIKQRCDLTGDELGGCTFPQTLRHKTLSAYSIGMVQNPFNIPASESYDWEEIEHICLNMLNKLFLWKSIFQCFRWGDV